MAQYLVSVIAAKPNALKRVEIAVIGIETHISTAYCDGGNGAIDLANSVLKKCDEDSNFRFIYDDNLSIKEKINVLAKEIYHASDVRFSTKAQKNIDHQVQQ